MGCTNSTPSKGPGPKPVKVGVQDTSIKPAPAPKPPPLTSIPEDEVEWETNPLWPQIIQREWEVAVASGKEPEFKSAFQDDAFVRVRRWLDEEHPACASAGTIEDMGKFEFPTSHGPCQLPARYFVTLDDDQTGLLYSLALVIAPPLKEEADQELWLISGSALNTPEMKGGQQAILRLLSLMQKGDVNVKHALVHIFMGSDMVTCKFDTTSTEPTITMLSDSPSSEFKESNDELAENALEDGEEARGIFQPLMLRTVVQRVSLEYPNGTVWDEGEFSFSVGEEPYLHPTRLIVVRDPKKMHETFDSAAFKMFIPGDDFEKELTLMRNLSPQPELGGVVSITLVVGLAPNTLWPKCGAFIDGAVFKAADAALIEYAKNVYSTGQSFTFKAAVAMGADRKVYKVVGNSPDFPYKPKQVKDQPKPVASPGQSSEEGKRQYTSLEAFSVSIEEIKGEITKETSDRGQAETNNDTSANPSLAEPAKDAIKHKLSDNDLPQTAQSTQILVA
ncbi:unnamed protein product [Clonostachys rosea f. rosea IK726]|jgi:hypothetical protein|uniref:Uncharacterized protein n=1 Tax=Clonostachys rosea f. rosea IK726 TaxID=1349383 RepID=A0ACA9UHY2_BIOOC|nr:unnamed protein product [Clonostachys rosea f. rosea IK726]